MNKFSDEWVMLCRRGTVEFDRLAFFTELNSRVQARVAVEPQQAPMRLPCLLLSSLFGSLASVVIIVALL